MAATMNQEMGVFEIIKCSVIYNASSPVKGTSEKREKTL